MKRLLFILLIFLSFSAQSQTKNIVPNGPHQGYIGTSANNLYWHGVYTDQINGIAPSAWRLKTDSLTWGLGLIQSGKITKLDTSNVSVLSRQRAANTYQPKGNYEVPLTFSSGLTRSTNTIISDTTVVLKKTTAASMYQPKGSYGGVTSVATGSGLTGGTITISGTIAIDTTVVLKKTTAASMYQPKASYLTTAITSLGGLTGTTQTFAVGTSGTVPAFSSATTTHTLNIPMASVSSVTAGLISKTEYDTFNGKVSNATHTGDVTGSTALTIASDAITYAKQGAEFKGDLTITGGTAIDWATGMYKSITLSGNINYTYSNLEKGKTIILKMTGSFTPYFPTGTSIINGGTYTGAKVNYLILTCVDTAAPLILMSVNTMP